MKPENMTKIISKCTNICMIAHAHQKDKIGEPYLTHPIRVSGIVASFFDDNWTLTKQTEIVCMSLLHDVIEDNHWGADDIRQALCRCCDDDASNVIETIIRGVIDLTHRKDMTYFEYIRSISVSNTSVILVKLADLKDNTSTRRLGMYGINHDEGSMTQIMSKYNDAKKILVKSLYDHVEISHFKKISRNLYDTESSVQTRY